MSKADELFGKTHYYKQNDIKEEGKLKRIEYRANLNEFINFDVEKKYIYVDGNLSIQELQAINEKVKELRLEQLDKNIKEKQ